MGVIAALLCVVVGGEEDTAYTPGETLRMGEDYTINKDDKLIPFGSGYRIIPDDNTPECDVAYYYLEACEDSTYNVWRTDHCQVACPWCGYSGMIDPAGIEGDFELMFGILDNLSSPARYLCPVCNRVFGIHYDEVTLYKATGYKLTETPPAPDTIEATAFIMRDKKGRLIDE